MGVPFSNSLQVPREDSLSSWIAAGAQAAEWPPSGLCGRATGWREHRQGARAFMPPGSVGPAQAKAFHSRAIDEDRACARARSLCGVFPQRINK